MSKRTAKFVSAIFASLLAGTLLATVSHGATDNPDSCLTRPKGAPPAGGHWYYRIDHATKRNCWYIGDEKEKAARAAPADSQPQTNSVSPALSPAKSATQRSIADARAELPLPQTRVEQEPRLFTAQPAPTAAVAATVPENTQSANTGDAAAGRSVIASRWPELAGAASSALAPSPAENSTVRPQQNSEAAPPVAAAAIPLAAADATSQKPPASIPMLLISIVAALALAGLLASAIFRFEDRRRTGRRVDRRAIWDSARSDRPSLADEARAVAPTWEYDLPREPRAVDDPNERIARMLARLARTAAT